MRVKTPEISWHDTTPIYSCDFQPLVNDANNDAWVRLATCGRDNMIRVWKVPETTCKPQFLTCLRRHDKPVNVVRFIPTGEDILASGSDDALVILWKREVTSSSGAAASSRNLFGEDGDDEEECSELWQVSRVLRRHLEDVYDLSWSLDGQCLISGSVDHSAIEWNLKSGQQLLLKDHKQYVQGVAWDPRDEYVLSMGSDRSCRVYRVGSRNCSYNVVRHEKQRLFQDDSWKSFFRRLSFSPDGSLIICPSGCHGMDGNAAYVFTRQSLPTPVLALPTESRPVVAVRFCPTLFQLPEGCTPIFALPYVLVFCLVLEDGLLIFNTVSKYPIAYVGAIHYQTLNDATWSLNGRMLVTCSTDGYCSVVQFDPNELGRPYTLEKSSVFNLSTIPESTTEAKKNTVKEANVDLHVQGSKRTNNVQASNLKNCTQDDNAKENKSKQHEDDKELIRSDKSFKSKTGEDNSRKSNVSKSASSGKNKSKETSHDANYDFEMMTDGTPEPTPHVGDQESNDKDMEVDICESEKENEITERPVGSVEPLHQTLVTDKPSEDSPIPAKKKRRVTFMTLENPDDKTGEKVEISVGVAAQSSKESDVEEKVKENVEEVPRKRRVPITTISKEPIGEESLSPMQVMKRRVIFTTLTSEVCPDDINDNLSNMSAPEFNLTLDDSMNETKKTCSENPASD